MIMNKETLEEDAERLYPDNIIKLGNKTSYNSALIKRKDFIDGAKWQQERMYNEEDLKEAFFSAIKSTGEGWNGEYASINNPDIKKVFAKDFEEWFEQFKKTTIR